jgi:SynChlorMet cassette protein ScmD
MEPNPIVNPIIVLREEFDDWAILFDPDTGAGFGLNPVSLLVWKQLDGKHTIGDIVDGLRDLCDEVPPEATAHVTAFIATLREKGLVGAAIP